MSGLIDRLNDVTDIVVAAEHEFAKTPAHHAYYDDRFDAVCEAVTRLRNCTCAASADTHPKGEDAKQASCGSMGSAVPKADARKPHP